MKTRARGCWTCQIRHRKCDLRAPLCKECIDRRIPCHGYGPKPAWMNGGSPEEQERSRIKIAVKENFRRVRRLQARARPDDNLQSEGPHQVPISDTPRDGPSERPHTSTIDLSAPLPKGVESEQQNSSNCAVTDNVTCRLDRTETARLSPEEALLLMHYLDRVFPWQFPYHLSHSRLGNRGWLLTLLMGHGPLYHATLSLAALHKSASCGESGEKFSVNQKAVDHHSRALQELCGFLREQCAYKLLEDDFKLMEFLACSLFLISFEVSGTSFDYT